MSLDKLPINLFDLVVMVVLLSGLVRGRKHGMSEELILLLQWLAILFGCASIYEWGAQIIGDLTGLLGLLGRYLLAYVGGAALIVLLFAVVKRGLGGKLLGSDVFGRTEYYLGMGSGLVRASCMLLVGLALLNARYFPPAEVRANEKYVNDVYGSDFFPTLYSVQQAVFERSVTGPLIKQHLGFLLIKPTQPEQNQLHMKDAAVP